jgi:hypothetical protein
MADELVFASAEDRADVGAFLARVVRLDPAGLVRLRASSGGLRLWAWLPLDVLVSRSVRADCAPADVTVSAKSLLDSLAGAEPPREASLALPARRDAEWRGALPPETGGHPLDDVPPDVVASLLDAAEKTFRQASAAADPRAVGDALLDHEVLTVSAGEASAGVPLRMLLALARMGFLGSGPVQVALVGGWVRLSASFGLAYLRRGGGLALFPGTSG